MPPSFFSVKVCLSPSALAGQYGARGGSGQTAGLAVVICSLNGAVLPRP